jgi:hypothetical protein
MAAYTEVRCHDMSSEIQNSGVGRRVEVSHFLHSKGARLIASKLGSSIHWLMGKSLNSSGLCL